MNKDIKKIEQFHSENPGKTIFISAAADMSVIGVVAVLGTLASVITAKYTKSAFLTFVVKGTVILGTYSYYAMKTKEIETDVNLNNPSLIYKVLLTTKQVTVPRKKAA